MTTEVFSNNILNTFILAGAMVASACSNVVIDGSIPGEGPDGGAIIGDGGPISGDVSRFEGCYWGTYGGDDSGTLEVTVDARGGVSVVATSPNGSDVYTGTVDGSGSLVAQGTIGGAYTISYIGALPETAIGRLGGGTWESSSGFTGSWDLEEAPLVGDYIGNYTSGVENGALAAEAQCDGTLQVIATTPRGPEVYTGFVERSGAVSASGIITGTAYTVQYTGSFRLVGGQRQGSGQWTSTSGVSGAWTAAGE